jgi:hypothetical protein
MKGIQYFNKPSSQRWNVYFFQEDLTSYLKGIIYLNLKSIVLELLTSAKQSQNLLAEIIYFFKKKQNCI